MPKFMLDVRALGFVGAFAAAVMFTPGKAHAVFFECEIDGVGEVTASYGPRVHVHCSNSSTQNGQVIRYLAIASSAASVQRFLSMATAAMLAGKRVRFDIHPSGSGGTVGGIVYPANAAGCGTGDCRSPISWDLLP